MFVPMRAEKWLLANQDGLLYEAFRVRFEAVLRVLSYYSNSVDVLFSPIQTLGSVQFHNYHEKRALFEKVLQQTYRPVDCEHQAHIEIESMQWWKRIVSEIGNAV